MGLEGISQLAALESEFLDLKDKDKVIGFCFPGQNYQALVLQEFS